ncbi:MAG: NAD(P)/FAD-dependent oxidoreductase [Acidimicrobiaceae bacterium]|nr:NAD(P)/FAD-dependent oxidoreductase [Acidimicrobiaceae bacterium]MYH43130.1 NAD(P)/FAD-dependent oxidoreductase [Acidimicrobiaceae bacterium]MYJ43633.1 NAD(P)/FAD-dependent oxidoreductase [Acidimicrobiaceae bacterium]MYJ81982.1 NAD(P)/FAD-dependent oxidoreductase [Acidimicrobiaceae bacterium]
MPQPDDRTHHWLVVGAGPSGLSVSLALRRAGVAFEGIEAGSAVGGMWNMDNPGSGMYDSAHFISSAARSGWADMPMPDHYPTYPRWWEIRDYIGSWAAHHDLARHYTFGTRVEQAVPVGSDRDQCWDVTLSTGEVHRYRGLVACPGFQRVPHVPTYPGRFGGEARHSQTYKSAEEFRGKRVMVVGAGNSAVDIAVDAAVSADRAASCAAWSAA